MGERQRRVLETERETDRQRKTQKNKFEENFETEIERRRYSPEAKNFDA